jgi:cytosine/adenosine deaminase-related metal-dependent hydrolase
VEQKTVTARWIFPVTQPPAPHGTITIRGDRIVALEAHTTRRADVDLGNVAILPGFVNVHTHLDLTGARGRCSPDPDFSQWLRRVIAFRRSRTPVEVQADIAAGLTECTRFGATLIGDISGAGASWKLLSAASCRAVVFHELLGLSEERAQQSWQAAQEWLQQHPSTDRCSAGLSPHSPYSVHRTLYSVLGAKPFPIATHLAETQAERELLLSHSGSFVSFLKELNAWDPSGLIAEPEEIVPLLPHGIFVHCNYLDRATAFTPGQSLVICPRTHAAFGHPHHPFPEMLRRGARVAIGTDSLASNPDLDILAEARFLRRQYPEVEPATLLRLLTLSGAEALGFEAVTGSLTVGKSADLVVVPLPDDARTEPHDLVFDSALPVQGVMFRGEWRI